MLNEMKNFIVEELKDRKGNKILFSEEIGEELTEDKNVTGSWYCNCYKAEQDIKNSFALCRNFCEWYEETIDEVINIPNGFVDPERFHVIIMLYGISELCNQIIYTPKYEKLVDSDNYITITDELIQEIEKDLQEVNTIFES